MIFVILWRCPVCNELGLEYTGPGKSSGYWSRRGLNFFCSHPERPSLGVPCPMEPISVSLTP